MNIEKITENKRIEIILNRPQAFPPLSSAVMQVQDKNIFEELKENNLEQSDDVKIFINFRKKKIPKI